MKKVVFSLTLLLLAVAGAMAQKSDLVVFSEEGEKFWLIVNGAKQNEKPLTNVRVKDLAPAGYKLKVIFEDQEAGSVDTYIAMDLYPGHEVTVGAKKIQKKLKTEKGKPQQYETKRKLAMVSTRPMNEIPAPPLGSAATPAEPEEIPAPGQETEDPSGNNNTTETVTMQVNGMPIAMPGVSVTTTTTTTTTKSSSSGTTSKPQTAKPAPQTPAKPVAAKPASAKPASRCQTSMMPGEFATAKSSISKQSFESEKIKVAAQITAHNCFSGPQLKEISKQFVHESNKLEFIKNSLAACHNLTAAQVKDLVASITHESNKLEVAKMAYNHTTDKGNYFVVNDALGYSSSIDELNEYISSGR